MDDIKKMQELWQEMSSWMTTYMKSFYSPEEAQKAKSHLDIKNTGTIFFDYCEPHTCDFNHELGEQNSQRI